MKDKTHHHYQLQLFWEGNRGKGTLHYTGYDRTFSLTDLGKAGPILGSADPSFRGDASRYNPEEMLLGALASCHMLWYLHLCAENGITVIDYHDHPEGTMIEKNDGSGHFCGVTLRPKVTVEDETQIKQAYTLHQKANAMCFIAQSVNFPVTHAPKIIVEKKA